MVSPNNLCYRSLRNAISDLNTVSNSTTRRLDDAYYSVLEKLSVLQGTIVSLRNLSSMTKQVTESFKSESGEIASEVESQIGGFQNFETQERRILELQERVEKGRQRIQTLDQRVDIVRQRVAGWEKAEGAWQEQARKRLRIIWIVVGVCVGLIIGTMAFQYRPTKTPGPEILGDLNISTIMESLPEVQGMKRPSRDTKGSGVKSLENTKYKYEEDDDKDILEDHPKLKLFDEL